LFSIIEAAGWPIWLLLIASVIGMALIIERLWYLRRNRIVPKGLLEEVIRVYREDKVNEETIERLEKDSPLGIILAAAVRHAGVSREEMRNAIEETGRGVAHQLERFLTTIGTIATLSPLMGLFGTVVGMIEIFGSQTSAGANPVQLAHGISIALYNTGFGLLIAMPTLLFYRHFRALVDSFLVEMEMQAARLVEVVHTHHFMEV
jgi:biopolymer transport protein ExbB